MRGLLLLFLHGIAVGLLGQTFTNVAPTVGITGGFGQPFFLGGGGVSFADFNGDGLDDLTFCTMFDQQLKFYLNNGNGFTLVNPPYVVNTQEQRHALWADIDNDGDMDLFVTAYLGSSRLYLNTGNMTFTDITANAGLPTTSNRTYGAVFGDYDRDGFLDLYVTHYGESPNGAPNFMYRNNGNLTFTDVTAATGTSNGAQQTFCATFFDYDNNGTSDLYVVNDRFEFPNALYSVSPNGTFADISELSGTDIAVLAMNGGVGDYNNDGFLDIYVTNTFIGGEEHCYLFHNNGDSTFTDSSSLAGVTFDRFGWGGNFFDFDNDRDQDLYVCSSKTTVNDEPNALYINQGNGTFTEPLFATNGLGGIDTMNSFSNAIGDYNNDGRPDIAVSNALWGITDYPFVLWRNDVVNSNNWIKIKLIGHQSNRDAIGAMLEFWINGTKHIRFTHTANAYLAQNSKTITFGLGSATAIDSLKIIWPSVNSVDVIPGSQLTINQTHTINETCNTNVVTSLADIGAGTLRSVLGCVQEGDTIFFDNTLAGGTITLTSQILQINKDVILYSTLSPNLTIASAISGAIETMPNTSVEIHKLNILSGPSGNPAALQNSGETELFQTNIMRHPALAAGNKLVQNTGAIFFHGNCTIEQ